MIKDQLTKNNTVGPNTKEIEKLRKVFPHYFDKNGNFMIDRLKELLSSTDVEMSKEGYELKFLGKSYAKLQTSTESKTVIVPDIEHNSLDPNDKSNNTFIVGDNIDAIKHMLKSYSSSVKCIYIDPPYNTRKDDFAYPDNFEFSKEYLVDSIGMLEDEADRILNMAGKSTHSAWLTFMYPRLLLSRDLLSDDGVIFISIDNNEYSNLKLLCDEIFGEENFIESIVWNKRIPKNDEGIGSIHEYILIYVKEKNQDTKFIMRKDGIDDIWELLLKAKRQNTPISEAEDQLRQYYDKQGFDRGITLYNTLDDKYEPWGKINMSWPNGNTEGPRYTILHPATKKPVKVPDRGWRWKKETFYNAANMDDNGNYLDIEELRDGSYRCGKMWFAKDENTQPSSIKYLREVEDMLLRSILSLKSDGGIELENHFGGKNYFSYPKPSNLISLLIYAAQLQDDDIVLDFFAGSSTTGEAVMKLNAEDGIKRRYFLVQLPEVIKEDKDAYKAGFRTIDEIGRARIDKAVAKIKSETNAPLDYGYKLYKLYTPEKKTLDKLVDFNPVEELALDDMINVYSFNSVSGRDTILTTWLNEDGYGLGAMSKKIKLKTYEADLHDGSLYIIEEGITSEDIMELIKKIENNELMISRIVVYPYSLPFNQSHELKKNIANLRQNKNITVIERY